jgi:hypothetical protein
MNPGRPARWRQLALLTVAVLAVHLALLRPGTPRLAPAREDKGPRFVTRTVLPAHAGAMPLTTAAAADREVSAPPPRPVSPAVRGARPGSALSTAKRSGAPRTTAALPGAITAWPSAMLHYEVQAQARGVTLAGTARLDWQQDGSRYEARLELAANGLRPRVQQSTGEIVPSGLAPERFSDRSRGEQATHFDRAGGRIVFSNNQPAAEWLPGTQDRLSVVLQLAMLAAAQPARFAPGTEVAIPTATTREAGDWIFRVLGEEDLQLPGGAVRALRLERLPRREYDQKVELWLAPGLAYAPVRLRLTNPDGGWVDYRWSSTDRAGAPRGLN